MICWGEVLGEPSGFDSQEGQPPLPNLRLMPLPDTLPGSLASPRCETLPPSTSPTPPGSPPGDPTPPTPPPASPRTSDATGSTPPCAQTSTAARSGSGSANTSATAPSQTPGAAPARPSPPARRNTWPGPDTAQSAPSPDGPPAASAAGSRTVRR